MQEIFKTKNIPNYPNEDLNLKYKLIFGNKYTWLIREDNDPSFIYVQTEKQDGMNGTSVGFELINGKLWMMKGPWHGNPDDLFLDTEIDLRNNIYTFIVIAEYQIKDKQSYSEYSFRNIYYRDNHWIKGSYDRGENIAKKISNELNKNLYCYIRSQGGGLLKKIKYIQNKENK